MDDNMKTFPNDDPSVTLTIRLIMQGKVRIKHFFICFKLVY